MGRGTLVSIRSTRATLVVGIPCDRFILGLWPLWRPLEEHVRASAPLKWQ